MPRPGWSRALATAFVVVLVVSLAGRLMAQNQEQTPAARFTSLLADGLKAYAEQRLDAANAAFQAMVDLAASQHDDLWKTRGLLGLGRVSLRLGKYAPAKAALLEAASAGRPINAFQELGMIEQSLGSIAELTGEPVEAAVAHYRQSAASYDSAGNRASKAAAEFQVLRSDRINRSNFEPQAVALRNEAIALKDPELEGSVLHLWGDVLFGTGSYEDAIEKLDEAVAVLEKTPPGQELATTYTSLGRIYRLHGQMKVALQYQLKSLDIAQKRGATPVVVQSLNAVAVTYASLGDVKQAKTYYERALALSDNVAPATRAFLRANYGAFLAENAGEQARGRELLAQALPDTTDWQLANRYAELAGIDFQLHRIDDAKAEVDHALGQCALALVPFDCIGARLLRAKIDLAQGDDVAALADHDAAVRELEDTHTKLAGEDFLKQGFEELWAPAYSLGIELHSRHGEVREALDLAERARSRALLDLLASRNNATTQPTPTPVSITTRGPRAATLRSDATADSATTDELTSMAARLHSTFVLYWVADDRIYEWVIAPNGALSSASVAVPKRKLEDLIQASSAFDDAAARGPAARTRGDQSISLVMKPRGAWRDLYDLLILPVEHYLPATAGSRVTIVPHGPLINVPFAALKDGQGRYLVERYALHSLTAGAMLNYTRNRTNGRTGSMLLVADPAGAPKIPGEPPLPRLPGAEAEVQAIAKLLPASRTTVLDDANATEPRVLNATASQSVLHFATHAIVRDTDPLSSFLALGRPADGSSNGQLTAEKIYRLKLDANLVVLSACRSGEGLPTGDGIAALARAFFYAGADSLIVSLWDIADEPTNRLLPAFYREWLKGADKARALRTAQLQLIADLRAGRVRISTAAGEVVVPEDPAFWAGFVLIGEPN